MTNRESFRTIVADLAEKAKATLPENAGRIDAAVALVLAGDVVLHPDGTALVGSATQPRHTYSVNGSCACPDALRAPEAWCKHRLGKAILIRAQRAMRDTLDAETATEGQVGDEEAGKGRNTSGETSDTARGNSGLPDALKPHIVYLHGKPFVQYAGLLALAHDRGLVTLKASFISVTAELALATAEATFADGRTFTEASDATPANVGATVRHAFARMALTRAKARCLRDGLNIGICALEELTGD